MAGLSACYVEMGGEALGGTGLSKELLPPNPAVAGYISLFPYL